MLICARAGARRQPEAARKGRERAAAQHGSKANGAGRAARRPWAAVGLRHKLNRRGQRAAKQAHQNKSRSLVTDDHRGVAGCPRLKGCRKTLQAVADKGRLSPKPTRGIEAARPRPPQGGLGSREPGPQGAPVTRSINNRSYLIWYASRL